MVGFNPRSPHGERPCGGWINTHNNPGFQSTLPTRGATRKTRQSISSSDPVSIHAPHTGSDYRGSALIIAVSTVSIHAPHTGSDLFDLRLDNIPGWFQSTLPTRGATLCLIMTDVELRVSIHAPHTGSDMKPAVTNPAPPGFNPRSPHGERRGEMKRIKLTAKFQSTLPTRGATQHRLDPVPSMHVSIHAPHTGSDVILAVALAIKESFNPRSPHGERP